LVATFVVPGGRAGTPDESVVLTFPVRAQECDRSEGWESDV
jgi:hypothetical protein